MENQTQEQFASVPASPEEVPGIQEGGEALSQDEMKTNLQDLMSQIENKYQEFNTQKFSSSNKIEEQKSMMLRSLYDVFESFGIDLTNAEQVKEFLDKLKVENPELYTKLEAILVKVIGDEESPENMNINTNETLQENI